MSQDERSFQSGREVFRHFIAEFRDRQIASADRDLLLEDCEPTSGSLDESLDDLRRSILDTITAVQI